MIGDADIYFPSLQELVLEGLYGKYYCECGEVLTRIPDVADWSIKSSLKRHSSRIKHQAYLTSIENGEDGAYDPKNLPTFNQLVESGSQGAYLCKCGYRVPTLFIN